MPTIAFLTVTVENLLNGDVISTANNSSWPYGAVVDTVDSKVKWTVVRDANGHLIQRIENGSTVVIERTVPTEEEAAALTQAERVRKIGAWTASAEMEYEKAKGYLLERLNDDPAVVSSYHRFEKLEQARIRLVFAAEAGAFAAKKFDGDIVAGFNYLCRVRMYELLKGYTDPTSRSLSFHSAALWTEHTMTRTIISEMEYIIGFDGLEKP